MPATDPTLADLLAAVTRLTAEARRPAARLLTQADAAAYLGVGTTLFTQLLAAGKVPKGRKMPSRTKAGAATFRLMWRREELDGWLEKLPPGESTGRGAR